MKVVENEVQDLLELKNNMLSTIATLEQDNKVYVKEYKETQKELFTLRTRNLPVNINLDLSRQQIEHVPDQQVDGKQQLNERDRAHINNKLPMEANNEVKKENKMLILGDSSVFDLYKFIERQKTLDNFKTLICQAQRMLREYCRRYMWINQRIRQKGLRYC
ncbi:unnamed protein product [Ceutorhynchus assimilis]|uniref:Uncharacterized protein n=1 Tax=Ceutorhynchus assimilis TaxID=467358 RepID=A0A9N9MFC5_9CUCU|nr:unnamed protein product [Ceutorhynchus assimilis]